MPITLKQMELVGEIDIHTDILSDSPSALSTKRAQKVGRIVQEKMMDKKGAAECIFCNPEKKEPNTYPSEVRIKDRVGGFRNDFPYLPQDQWVFFLWNDSPTIRREKLHRYKLMDLGALELYWLLKAAVDAGNKFEIPKTTNETWGMVVGFNLGRLAGQSIPHFHVQYGWEVALNAKRIKHTELALYYEELNEKELIIYENEEIRLIAPWTPKGQYAADLHFNNKFEFSRLSDSDVKLFAVFGSKLIEKYVELGIQNLNIVFTNSPVGRETEPLVAHFVPRVNMTALYEIKGVNVVDTPPRNIAVELSKYDSHKDKGIQWGEVFRRVRSFEPDFEYDKRVSE